jgi:hypothetical protein
VAVVGITGVVPLVQGHDSFPLSTFPMFSTRRTTTEQVDTAVGLRADGSVERLSPERIGGTDEVILAAATVTNAIVTADTPQLCREIAGRVAGGGPRDVTQVQVVTEVFDAVRWYHGDRTPLARTVHATCAVG